MALIMLEGFEKAGTRDFFMRKPGWSYSSTPSFRPGLGRFGGDCIECNSQYDTIVYDMATPLTDSIWFGVAFKKQGFGAPTLQTTYTWMSFYSAETIQVKITLNANRGLNVYTGATLKFSTADNVIIDDTWQYIEVYLKISNTVGEIIIRLDGNEILNETGYDSQGASNTNISRLLYRYIYYDSACLFDDMYVNDSEFMGEIKVVAQVPTSDGTHGDFLPLGGGDHYVEVDEATPDEDTSYVEGKEKGEKESFGISTTGLDGKIVGVQLNQFVKRTDIQTTGVKGLVRVGGSDYLGSDEQFLSTDYNYISNVWENNPDTSNPWKETSLANAEFGIEITSLSTTTTTV